MSDQSDQSDRPDRPDRSDESEQAEQIQRLDDDLLAAGDRPLFIPSELPVLPLRDTVLFPNSFMPLAVAREASVRLIDEATTSGAHDRRLHAARGVGRGAAAGRSLSDRHRHAHPQDVQAARTAASG